VAQAPVPHGHRGADLTLHQHPPATPARVLLRWGMAVPALLGLFTVLAMAAALDEGSALLTLDEPVSRALMEIRSGALDEVVKTVSGLGGLTVVTVVLAVLVLLVWHECRALAYTLLAASAARPPLEWALKELVDRPRPDMDRLVAGNGPSFPSGHVMAAVAIWGLLPPVVALVSGRRIVWWWSVGISGTVVVAVAFSRVYLGVHWLSDTLGALLLGALYLLGVQRLLDWHHRRRPCRTDRPPHRSATRHGWREGTPSPSAPVHVSSVDAPVHPGSRHPP
jgi:undecaprenyl-diphosphatase